MRWGNLLMLSSAVLKTGWDMDAFLVVSFGRKVFRTRSVLSSLARTSLTRTRSVIRHSLNPVWDEKLFFHVRHTERTWELHFNLFDWDKMSSNDHVGDVSVPLSQLIGEELQPDERGLYPCSKEGKLLGDEFREHELGVHVVDKEGVVVGGPKLMIRAKYTPYGAGLFGIRVRTELIHVGIDALRQQFWRCYLRQYDIDESGAFSHLEIFSMLDSLGPFFLNISVLRSPKRTHQDPLSRKRPSRPSSPASARRTIQSSTRTKSSSASNKSSASLSTRSGKRRLNRACRLPRSERAL